MVVFLKSINALAAEIPVHLAKLTLGLPSYAAEDVIHRAHALGLFGWFGL